MDTAQGAEYDRPVLEDADCVDPQELPHLSSVLFTLFMFLSLDTTSFIQLKILNMINH